MIAGGVAALIGLAGFGYAQHAGIPAPTVSFAAQQQGAVPFELYRGNRVMLAAKVNGQRHSGDSGYRRERHDP